MAKLKNHSVTATVGLRGPITLQTFQGEEGRDWTAFLETGPARSTYVAELERLGLTHEEANSAVFTVTELP